MLRPRWFFKNLVQKVIAVIFAVLLWIYIQGELGINFSKYLLDHNLEVRKMKNTPVEMLISMGNTFDISIKPSVIDIALKGSKEHLDTVLSGDFLLYVNLRDINNAGVYRMPVRIFELPKNVYLADELSSVEVTIEQRVSRFESEPAPGLPIQKKPSLGFTESEILKIKEESAQ